MESAPFVKRAAASLIDVIFIYTSIPAYVYVKHYDVKYLHWFVFAFSLFLQSVTYLGVGQTLGERCLGLKVVTNEGSEPSKLSLVMRSFLKSTVFVPWVMGLSSVAAALMLIVLSVVIQFASLTRGRRLMVWDAMLHMVVTEGGPQADWRHPFRL